MIPILVDLSWNTIGTFLEDIPTILPNMGHHWYFFGRSTITLSNNGILLDYYNIQMPIIYQQNI